MRTSRRLALALTTVAIALSTAPQASAADCPDVTPASAEAAFLSFANEARSSSPLSSHDAITRLARDHANEMATDGKIFHSDVLGEVLDMGANAAGENVGTGCTARLIHDAFMGSPAHRDNIMDGRFTHAGIGVVIGDRGAIYVAEVFAALPTPSQAPVSTPRPQPTALPTPASTPVPTVRPTPAVTPIPATQASVATAPVDEAEPEPLATVPVPEPPEQPVRTEGRVQAAGEVEPFEPAASVASVAFAAALMAIALPVAARAVRRRRTSGPWELR